MKQVPSLNRAALAAVVLVSVFVGRAVAQVHPPAPNVDARAVQVAGDFETAVMNRDAASARAMIDAEAIGRRAIAGISQGPEFEQGFLEGFVSNFTLVDDLLTGLGDAGTYKLLRVRQKNGEWRALYRFLAQDGGLNFHDALIAIDDRGAPRIIDMYIALTGQEVSEAVGMLAKAAIQQGVDDPSVEAVERLANAIGAGRFQEALDIYASLPATFRSQKSMLALRAQAAVGLDNDEEIVAAGQEFAFHHPNDPAFDLMTLDLFIVRESWDRAIGNLERIDAAVEGDAYVQHLIGALHSQAGRPEENLTYQQKAAALEPSLEDPHWAIVEDAISKEDYETVAKHLTLLCHRAGVTFDDLRAVDFYRGFVESGRYDAWLKEVVLVEALDSADTEWLEQLRGIGRNIISFYLKEGAPLEGQPVTADALDRTFAAYMADESDQQPTGIDVARGLGALIGDHLVNHASMKWVVYTNATIHRNYALHHERSKAVAFPIQDLIGLIQGGQLLSTQSMIDAAKSSTEAGG